MPCHIPQAPSRTRHHKYIYIEREREREREKETQTNQKKTYLEVKLKSDEVEVVFALAQGRGVEDQGRSEPYAHERSVRGVRVAGHPTLRNQMDLLGAEDEDHSLAEALQGGEEPPTQLVQPALGQDALEPHPRTARGLTRPSPLPPGGATIARQSR